MKTKEELNALKEEVETLSKKLAELSEDELAQIAGGDVTTDLLNAACPTCYRFTPVDGNRENRQFSNCTFYYSSASYGIPCPGVH